MGGVRVTRREAVAVLAAGLALLVAGVVWLFGPFGLIGAGVVLAVVALFGLEVGDGAETLEPASDARGDAVRSAAGPR